jgi:hypothetical protein
MLDVSVAEEKARAKIDPMRKSAHGTLDYRGNAKAFGPLHAISIMLPTARAHIQLAARLLEHLAHLFHALERGGLAGSRRLRSRGSVAKNPPSPWFCLLAKARTSWLICIEQNLGPHIEQKCAVLAPSAGKVWS